MAIFVRETTYPDSAASGYHSDDVYWILGPASFGSLDWSKLRLWVAIIVQRLGEPEARCWVCFLIYVFRQLQIVHS